MLKKCKKMVKNRSFFTPFQPPASQKYLIKRVKKWVFFECFLVIFDPPWKPQSLKLVQEHHFWSIRRVPRGNPRFTPPKNAVFSCFLTPFFCHFGHFHKIAYVWNLSWFLEMLKSHFECFCVILCIFHLLCAT